MLYNDVRPTLLKDVYGHPEVVKSLLTQLKRKTLPHVILFSGPRGSGKTTIARILARKIMGDNYDFFEINCPIVDPLEHTRKIQQTCIAPGYFSLNKQAWILDEFQSFSRAGFTQQAWNKILEDEKDFLYFFLCTTDPGKIFETIRSRCVIIKLKALDPVAMKAVLRDATKKLKVRVSDDIVDTIIQQSDGSARSALTALEKVLGADNEKDRKALLIRDEDKNQLNDLCRALMDTKCNWTTIAAILKGLEGEEPEQIRRGVLGYARAVLLKAPNGRAADIIRLFRFEVYDSGHAGLAESCFRLVRK